jgi:hypothetical protein
MIMFSWEEFREYQEEMHRPEKSMIRSAFNQWLDGNDLFEHDPSKTEMSFYYGMFRAG